MSKLLKRLNDNQNKVADTNGIMKLQAWDYGVVQDLTNKQITATVANTSGFLFDIDLVSNGTEIDLDFKDNQLQKLTPDTYFLEIKVTDKDGDVSVFPTEGYATFTINKNLHATEGALVPQITFDTVLADVKTAMDKTVADYVKTIAKGDKGDTVPQGPQGIQGKQGIQGPKGDKGDTGPTGAKGADGVVDYTKTVNTTGNQTVAGEKTFSNKLTVNDIVKADWFYKHLKKGTMSASIMEVLDDNLDGRRFSVGKYYSGFTHGNGLSLTGNGLTAIGGGESSSTLLDKISKGETDTTALPASAMGDEKLILTSDQDIYLLPGQQSAPNYEGNWRISTSGYWDRYDTASKKWVNIIGNNTGVLAQDSQVVHNTKNETVAGNKTFSGNTTIGGTLMTDSGWKTIPLLSGMSAGVHRYRILNGVVYVQVGQVKGATDGQDMLTLPAEARPDVDLFFPWKTGDKSGNLHIWAKTGKISVASGNSTDKTVTYSMVTSYPAV